MYILLNPWSAKQNCSRRHSFFIHYCFWEEIRFDISYELSARQTIHMKCRALFSLKNEKKKNSKYRKLHFWWHFKVKIDMYFQSNWFLSFIKNKKMLFSWLFKNLLWMCRVIQQKPNAKEGVFYRIFPLPQWQVFNIPHLLFDSSGVEFFSTKMLIFLL